MISYLPQWYEFENADVFGRYRQHMEGSPQIRGKGDVMYWVSHSHQRLCFGILPKGQHKPIRNMLIIEKQK